MMSCMPQGYASSEHLEASAFIMMPQWMEFMSLHGVEQFIMTVKPWDRDEYLHNLEVLEPFLRSGLVTLVEQNPDHEDVFNECLYRAKGRTDWFTPAIEFDEYWAFNEGGDPHVSFPDALDAIVASSNNTYGVSHGREIFLHPSEPTKQLQIESQMRMRKLQDACPKYVVRPDRVHALFNHWATSWDEGWKSIGVPTKQLVACHYRSTNATETPQVDKIMTGEIAPLAAAVAKRYEGFKKPVDTAADVNPSIIQVHQGQSKIFEQSDILLASQFAIWSEQIQQGFEGLSQFVFEPPSEDKALEGSASEMS